MDCVVSEPCNTRVDPEFFVRGGIGGGGGGASLTDKQF